MKLGQRKVTAGSVFTESYKLFARVFYVLCGYHSWNRHVLKVVASETKVDNYFAKSAVQSTLLEVFFIYIFF